MILEKVIHTIDIQSEYKELVDKYIDRIRTEFKGKFHSIYMCGSIPKGTAKPFKSDADFTLVCENPEDIDYEKLSKIKDELLKEYPLVTKIDTILCSVDDVLNKPHEWGFWVKVICVCVYGDDVGEKVPPILISPAFIVDLNTETKEEIDRIHGWLSKAADSAMKNRYIKGYSKRLLRALYSLIIENTGVWEDDIFEMKNAILNYCEIDPALVDDLYACYLDSDVPVEEFLPIADEVYRYFESALNTMKE
ncbi:nucleotidyltransferase domain-containing protein [Saccharibacillus sp. CPCC 101409]|uniref:nucleotidyltransferase domain-containing protein n=1 Tax=Saccharibacillus sp. CPCC 101409 TaxID=3058041 RepID=UPI002671E385|nr:nucleotidyltransferase domain-containing protein [Saccharibacillus sp. CPCC 101409]MDO3410939.1 nucleotidyltransferase domain-containing protein [Saccharibacillus sp. CPCC 101409]